MDRCRRNFLASSPALAAAIALTKADQAQGANRESWLLIHQEDDLLEIENATDHVLHIGACSGTCDGEIHLGPLSESERREWIRGPHRGGLVIEAQELPHVLGTLRLLR